MTRDGGPPACPTHRALVDAALGPDPTDDVLDAYADAVPTCPACRRALAVWLADRDGDGVVRLQPLPGDQAPPLPIARRRGVRRIALAVVAAAAGVTLAVWVAVGARRDPVDRRTPDADVVVVEPLPVPVPPDPGLEAPSPPPPPTEVARDVAPQPAPVPAVAVARSDDWAPPPFEDLRLASAKGADAAVQAVQLVLLGPGRPSVGDRVGLEVVAARETAIAVCVDGPERGVVWRGAVPAGQTALSRGGRGQSFAFAAPGTYRFRVAVDADAAGCEPAVHRVDVEVGGGG